MSPDAAHDTTETTESSSNTEQASSGSHLRSSYYDSLGNYYQVRQELKSLPTLSAEECQEWCRDLQTQRYILQKSGVGATQLAKRFERLDSKTSCVRNFAEALETQHEEGITSKRLALQTFLETDKTFRMLHLLRIANGCHRKGMSVDIPESAVDDINTNLLLLGRTFDEALTWGRISGVKQSDGSVRACR